MSDHYIVGDSYRCVWVVREYPPSTEEQAILSQLADRNGVTLRIYHRLVESVEQRKIIQNATRRNKMKSGGNDMNDTIEAEGNLQDVIEMLANLRKNREPLLHCSVFMELKAKSMNALKELQSDIAMELTRSKIMVDRLTLRQQEGFLSVLPVGSNQFGEQFERVLPASSVANLYPFNFSGKTDPQGLYIGRDKYGTNILVDFDRRAEDKTTSNVLILGNSGQGKSHLMKLILTNLRESGKGILVLDAESEYKELCEEGLGGCYIDFMTGEYKINPLEPKVWSDGLDELEIGEPEAFQKVTRLSQHIAFLKDFFRSYKDFTDVQIDTIEIMLGKLYEQYGIHDSTDYSQLKSTDYPVMEDFYTLCENEFLNYDREKKHLYTEETLQEVCLGIHSMCVGAESVYFNGHTNITDDAFLVFGVKGLIIQSFSQLEKNYGKEGAEIIIDNTQLTIFGGFAPNSTSAEVLSKSLGSRTVLSGSVSRGKNDPSQSLQMIERPLMTPDELKSMPKGQFVVMKTGFYPMRVKLKLFFKWGIEFEDEYEVTEHGNRRVAYAEKQEIIDGIRSKYQPEWLEETEIPPNAYPMGGQQQTRTQLRTTPKTYREVNRNG